MKGIFGQVAAAVIWGLGAPVVKIVLYSVSPYTFVFLRLAIAVLLLTPFVYHRLPAAKLTVSDFFHLTIMGLLAITLNIGLYFVGQSYTTVIDAAVILSTMSVFTAVGAFLFLGERKSKIVLVGIFLSSLGTIIIIIQPIWETGLFHAKNILGNILILLATLSWVSFTILSKEVRQKYDAFVKTYFLFLVGLFSFFPLSYRDVFNLNFYLQLPVSAVLGIIYEGVFATVVAYLLFNWSLKYVSATNSGVIAYLIPVTSIIASIIFLGEKITLPFLVGTGVVATGIFLAEMRHPVHPFHHLHKKSRF